MFLLWNTVAELHMFVWPFLPCHPANLTYCTLLYPLPYLTFYLLPLTSYLNLNLTSPHFALLHLASSPLASHLILYMKFALQKAIFSQRVIVTDFLCFVLACSLYDAEVVLHLWTIATQHGCQELYPLPSNLHFSFLFIWFLCMLFLLF